MHRTFCVGGIEHGEVAYRIGERTVTLQPGSLALINPEVLHSCNPVDGHNRSYYMLFFDIDWCLQLQQSLWQIDTFCPADTIMLEDSSLHLLYISTMASLMAQGYLLEKDTKTGGSVNA